MTGLLRMDPAEIAEMRRAVIEDSILPLAEQLRTRHADRVAIRSIAVCVAQYWDDEASDAVHCRWVFSELAKPIVREGLIPREYDELGPTDRNLPDDVQQIHLDPKWDEERYWEDNGYAIPIAAAWCMEGASSDDFEEDYFLPFVVLSNTDGHWSYQLAPMVRPWLDGVRSQDLVLWPTADEVWERSLNGLPPTPRAGDISLDRMHKLADLLANATGSDRADRSHEETVERVRGEAASFAKAAKFLMLHDLSAVLLTLDDDDDKALAKITDLFPTGPELKETARHSWFNSRYGYSPERPDGKTRAKFT